MLQFEQESHLNVKDPFLGIASGIFNFLTLFIMKNI